MSRCCFSIAGETAANALSTANCNLFQVVQKSGGQSHCDCDSVISFLFPSPPFSRQIEEKNSCIYVDFSSSALAAAEVGK